MTWKEWVNTDYNNKGNYIIYGETLYYVSSSDASGGYPVDGYSTADNEIQANYAYSFSTTGLPDMWEGPSIVEPIS